MYAHDHTTKHIHAACSNRVSTVNALYCIVYAQRSYTHKRKHNAACSNQFSTVKRTLLWCMHTFIYTHIQTYMAYTAIELVQPVRTQQTYK
jgi:hypothetical protein